MPTCRRRTDCNTCRSLETWQSPGPSNTIKQLTIQSEQYLEQSIAPSTRRQYQSAVNKYEIFCYQNNLKAFPLCQQNVILFVTNLASKVSYKYIKTHMAAIHHYSYIKKFKPIFTKFHHLYLVLRGIKRVQQNKYNKEREKSSYHFEHATLHQYKAI